MKANSEIEIHNFTHINSIKIENKNSILLNNETNLKSVIRNQFNPNSLCFWMLSMAGVTCVKKTFEKSSGKITPPTIRVKKSSLKIDFSFHVVEKRTYWHRWPSSAANILTYGPNIAMLWTGRPGWWCFVLVHNLTPWPLVAQNTMLALHHTMIITRTWLGSHMD